MASASNNSLFYTRKRSRSHVEEEGGEFTPLSKRINNLHINNPAWKHINQCGEGTAVLRQVASRSHYSPDLGPSENPFYYENNRLLYSLYLERSQRTGEATY